MRFNSDGFRATCFKYFCNYAWRTVYERIDGTCFFKDGKDRTIELGKPL